MCIVLALEILITTWELMSSRPTCHKPQIENATSLSSVGSPSGCASFLNGTVIWLPPNTTQAEVADALNAQTDVSLLRTISRSRPASRAFSP